MFFFFCFPCLPSPRWVKTYPEIYEVIQSAFCGGPGRGNSQPHSHGLHSHHGLHGHHGSHDGMRRFVFVLSRVTGVAPAFSPFPLPNFISLFSRPTIAPAVLQSRGISDLIPKSKCYGFVLILCCGGAADSQRQRWSVLDIISPLQPPSKGKEGVSSVVVPTLSFAGVRDPNLPHSRASPVQFASAVDK